MMRFSTLALAALPILGACAQGPDSIQPVSMGNAYAGVDCGTASAERAQSAQRLAALSSAQRGAQAGDAVGVFLIGVPVSSLTGGNKAGEIGAEKGRIAALDARLLSCR